MLLRDKEKFFELFANPLNVLRVLNHGIQIFYDYMTFV